MSWRDEAGKLRQVSRSVRGSGPDAQRIRDELRHRHHRNDLERAASEDFETVLNEWLAMRERPLSPSTVEGYLGDIRRYIAPSLGKIRVSRLTARDLDRFYLSMQERGLSAGTIGRLHSIVRSALEQRDSVRRTFGGRGARSNAGPT